MSILSITATDTTTGAGLLADIKVAAAHNVRCQAIVVAITAQNSQGAQAAFAVPRQQLERQWQSVRQDGWPAYIRLGWLPADVDTLNWLLAVLSQSPSKVLWDPVLKASQGCGLSQDWQNERIKPLLAALLQRVDLLTPNAAEALNLYHWLSGERAQSAEQAAHGLQRYGHFHCLVTGIKTSHKVKDYFCFNPHNTWGQEQLPGPSLSQNFYLSQRWLAHSRHGTGCHLIAQLSCRLAQGQSLYDALIQAVHATATYLQAANGHTAAAWPEVEIPAQCATAFPPLARPLGLYGLVDNLEHLKRLLELGIDTLQWRVKTRHRHYQAAMAKAIELCAEAQVPLFINDDWQLAISLNAYGVHLGQEDLATADLHAIQQASLRLGISTHSDWEIARAYALKPSYIACGPVFPPLSKKLQYPPLGLARLGTYLARYPEQSFTCIGGITSANAQDVWRTGVSSVAVVTDLANDAGLAVRIKQLRRQ